MLPNRFRITKETSEQLKLIKARTGVTPNILCRLAIAHSFKDHRKIKYKKQDLTGIEFNSSTLFGNYVKLYESLFRQVYGQLDSKKMEAVVATHIDEGVKALRSAKSLSDLVR